MMEVEVAELIGAHRGERRPEDRAIRQMLSTVPELPQCSELRRVSRRRATSTGSKLGTSPLMRFADPTTAGIWIAVAGDIELGMERTASRVQHPHSQPEALRRLQVL